MIAKQNPIVHRVFWSWPLLLTAPMSEDIKGSAAASAKQNGKVTYKEMSASHERHDLRDGRFEPLYYDADDSGSESSPFGKLARKLKRRRMNLNSSESVVAASSRSSGVCLASNSVPRAEHDKRADIEDAATQSDEDTARVQDAIRQELTGCLKCLQEQIKDVASRSAERQALATKAFGTVLESFIEIIDENMREQFSAFEKRMKALLKETITTHIVTLPKRRRELAISQEMRPAKSGRHVSLYESNEISVGHVKQSPAHFLEPSSVYRRPVPQRNSRLSVPAYSSYPAEPSDMANEAVRLVEASHDASYVVQRGEEVHDTSHVVLSEEGDHNASHIVHLTEADSVARHVDRSYPHGNHHHAEDIEAEKGAHNLVDGGDEVPLVVLPPFEPEEDYRSGLREVSKRSKKSSKADLNKRVIQVLIEKNRANKVFLFLDYQSMNPRPFQYRSSCRRDKDKSQRLCFLRKYFHPEYNGFSVENIIEDYLDFKLPGRFPSNFDFASEDSITSGVYNVYTLFKNNLKNSLRDTVVKKHVGPLQKEWEDMIEIVSAEKRSPLDEPSAEASQ